VAASHFEGQATAVGRVAEHGFAALVTIRRGPVNHYVAVRHRPFARSNRHQRNRLGLDLDDIHAVVLSRGRFDHVGGLAGLIDRGGARRLPMVVYPLVWTRRRMAVPGQDVFELPTLSRRALAHEGIDVIERRVPSLLVDGAVLITGESTAPPSPNMGCHRRIRP
jgi:7,8-dihydropterin-6-yl-methyl-4-(beta-D-ribofuranosyl)aminobenzene 5'-phosphate synthase